MVHALQETQRVLRPGGGMIDVRPAPVNRIVELELAYARLYIGEIDSSRTILEQEAADAALREVAKQGLFCFQHAERFQVEIHLDTLDDLRAHAATLRKSIVSEDIFQRISSLIADEDEGTFSISISRAVNISSYLMG